MTLTPHPLLVPRSKTEYSYTSTVPKGLRGLWKVETYLYLCKTHIHLYVCFAHYIVQVKSSVSGVLIHVLCCKITSTT